MSNEYNGYGIGNVDFLDCCYINSGVYSLDFDWQDRFKFGERTRKCTGYSEKKIGTWRNKRGRI